MGLMLLIWGGLASPSYLSESIQYDAPPVYVFFTCDVETLSDGTPERDIWGKIGDQYHGITRMMDIFDEHQAKLTFFVNVYEVGKFGHQAIRDICETIVERGHDIQLHTHPASLFEGYATMQAADYEMQKKILTDGKRLLSEFTGQQIIAHRAGGYSANYNTLLALKEAEFHLDSSLNHAWPSCGLNKPPLTINKAKEVHGLIEVPVTVYYEIKFDTLKRLRFVDIESSSLDEFKKVLDSAIAHRIPTVVVMMHSFSFTRFGEASLRVEEKLSSLLQYVGAHERLQAITFSDFYRIYRDNPDTLEGNDFIPTTGILLTYMRAWQRLDEGGKNIVFAFSPVMLLILPIAAFVVLRFRSRQRISCR